MNVKAACDTSMPLKGRSETESQCVPQESFSLSALTSEVRILSDRLLVAVSTELAENLQVVICVWPALAIVQVPELGDDELRVATVLVQVGSAGRRVGLVILRFVSVCFFNMWTRGRRLTL